LGDRIVQFVESQGSDTDFTTDTSITHYKSAKPRVILYPGTDTIQVPLYPDATSVAYLVGYNVQSSGLLPNHGNASLFNRNEAGMIPMIETESKKNRVVIPYHCPNKFVVNAIDEGDHNSPPFVDQFSQGLLVYSWHNNRNNTYPKTTNIEVWFQYGDGFRMSHYRPVRYQLAGCLSQPPSLGYFNYFGQYFGSV
jgi:hypothetical protein